jgi:hypothetical protein
MRLPAAFGALCFLATISFASAQIQLSAQTQRTDFMLYERVDLYVTIVNESESDLMLNNDEGHPWLSFLVSKHNKLPVRPERQGTFKPISLKVGETKTLKINLTPLFSFREEGDYSASAVVDLPGQGEIMSDNVPFTVMKGREVWTDSRPVAGTRRVYSLLRFSPKFDETKLYLRVEEPDDNVVLANLALGDVVAYVDPEVFFDPQGNLHVMQPIAMGTYLYTRADATGKVLHQTVFKTYQEIRPRLTKMEDGNIIVVGGQEENPSTPREHLSDGQKQAGGPLEKKADSGPLPDTAAPAPAPAPGSTPTPGQ